MEVKIYKKGEMNIAAHHCCAAFDGIPAKQLTLLLSFVPKILFLTSLSELGSHPQFLIEMSFFGDVIAVD